jgi:hypothetical protein
VIEIPPELEWWRARPEGAAWLERLPLLDTAGRRRLDHLAGDLDLDRERLRR